MTKRINQFHNLKESLIRLIIQNEAGIPNNEKLAFLIEQCERKDKRIYSSAMKEALYHVYRMESYMLGLYVSRIIKIDASRPSGLSEALMLAGAAKKHPRLNGVPEKADLLQLLNVDSEFSFLCNVSGDSMIEANINHGDILLVNSSIEPKHGNIVIAEVDGNLLVKRYTIIDGELWLFSENPDFPNIRVYPDLGCRICGVVMHIIRKAL